MAGYLKATFVYPENNVRVQDALNASVVALNALSHREERTSIRIAGEVLLPRFLEAS